MKRQYALLILLFLAQSFIGQAQFQSLRYNEDYAHMQNDSVKSWYSKLKFQKLNSSGSAYVSQGGEVRYQYQYFQNEDWGEVPVKSYHSFYTRFLYHADWHFSNRLRLFTQVNSTFAVGRVTPIRPIDQNVLDIQQVFADAQLSNNFLFRFGRQELLYGSQRLIAVREGPNNRQSYDALKIVWKKPNLQADVFYSHPVKVQQELFDDRFNRDERLWSFYTVINKLPALANIDLYYIGYWSKEKTYESGSGEELRHSIGTRIWRKSSTLHYDFETLYQFGKWGNQSILAYTASLDANYTFVKARWQPTVGVKTEFISGDRTPGDNKLNTFNPLFPRGAYFGLAALIGPSNLADVHPAVSVSPFSNLTLSADYDAFWRYSTNDGIYGPNVMVIFDKNSSSRFIGHQLGVAAEYEPNDFLKLTPELLWFFPGAYLRDVSAGKQVFFAAFTAQCKF